MAIMEASHTEATKLPGHLTPRLAGTMAAGASIGTLVLTHRYPEVTEDTARKSAAREFAGEVIIAGEGMEIGLPRRKLSMLKQAAQRPTSLDAPINEGEATRFSEIIGDERAESPFQMLADKNMHKQLDGLLSVLDERERRIIDERFGLNGKKPMTLEDVGREFGVTRERIRQLQNVALDKMRRALRRKEKPLPQPVSESAA